MAMLTISPYPHSGDQRGKIVEDNLPCDCHNRKLKKAIDDIAAGHTS
jgi:hypothetical protein